MNAQMKVCKTCPGAYRVFDTESGQCFVCRSGGPFRDGKPVIPQPQPISRSADPARWMPSKGEVVLAVVCLGVFVAGMFAGRYGTAPVCEPAHTSRVYQA